MWLNKKVNTLVKPIVEKCPRIASVYRTVRDECAIMREPIVTPWGFKLVGNADMARGAFEPIETELVRSMLKDVDVLINIGANIGYYCCHALSMGKLVIAFEPMQRNLRYLYQNVNINGWSGIEIYPLALSNAVGVCDIYGCGTGASTVKGWAGTSESYVSLVPTSTMDLVLGSRFKGQRVLIIVDVEGAERAVIGGAAAILANDPKPTWLMEVSVAEHQPQGVTINPFLADTFRCMFAAGYQAITATKEMRSVTMDEVLAAQKGDVSALGTHNFLFQ